MGDETGKKGGRHTEATKGSRAGLAAVAYIISEMPACPCGERVPGSAPLAPTDCPST